MKTRRYILALIVIGFSLQYAAAQGRFGITYNTALPLGETADLVGKYSFRGFGLEGRWEVGNKLDIGFNASWNVFYESASGSFSEGSSTLTGTQYRYLNAYPIMFTAYKGFGNSETFFPYVGMGVGTIKADSQKEMGLWYQESNNWHFGIAPEIGAIISPLNSFDFIVSIRYNYGVKVKDSPAVSYLGINLGVLL
jgi:opacity protein-like surface antigen